MTEFIRLTDLMSPIGLKLLTGSGKAFIQQIGSDVARDVVYNVLVGRNLRDSTEVLTRRRISILNLALVDMFLKGSTQIDNFVEQLPYIAASNLKQGRLSKSERWLAQWILGLTDKSSQNVLRGSKDALESYRNMYIETCARAIANQTDELGVLNGELSISNQVKAQVNWLFLVYLLNTVGAQTLATRGSEKSAYGKLFEKLILGSMLYLLGFTIVPPERPGTQERVFWLSQRGDKRESDATLLYSAGKAVKFDIGFIGRGNTEISLDKVTRFERELVMNARTYIVETIIIVDTIGKGSRTPELARRVGGYIVQMSAAYWIKEVARILSNVVGFAHPILMMENDELDTYIKAHMRDVPLERLLDYTVDVELGDSDTQSNS